MSHALPPHYHHHHIAPPAVDLPEARVPTDLDEYLFDLQGYLILRGLLSKAEVADANARIDTVPRSLPRGGWHAGCTGRIIPSIATPLQICSSAWVL
jgi:hypothetical protein